MSSAPAATVVARVSGASRTQFTARQTSALAAFKQLSFASTVQPSTTESQPSPQRPSAVVFGATGEVGRQVVRALLELDVFERVTTLGRRPLVYDGPNSERLVQKTGINFDTAESDPQFANDMRDHHFAFSCIGTTRAKAGSAEAFYKVDHDYAVNSAKAAHVAGVKHFTLVSASMVVQTKMLLYPRTKLETEEDISKIGFEKTVIMRPALLESDRQEQRAGEKLAKWMLPMLKKVMSPKKLSIETSVLGDAMVWNAIYDSVEPKKPASDESQPAQEAVRIFENHEIFDILD